VVETVSYGKKPVDAAALALKATSEGAEASITDSTVIFH
jgi:hypothetical protein